MTANQLAAILGVSRRHVFNLKAEFPEEVPEFDDLDKWRAFVAAHKISANPAKQKESAKSKSPKSATRRQSSDDAYIEARARKTLYAAELALIQVDASKRNVIRKEEVKDLFARIASVVRGRFLKVKADLPCSCVGLTESEIEKVVDEKIQYALSALDIPSEFFQPQGVV